MITSVPVFALIEPKLHLLIFSSYTDYTKEGLKVLFVKVVKNLMCSTLSLLMLMSFLQILSQASQNQSQQHIPVSSATSSLSAQIQPPPTLPPLPGLSPAQFVLHGSLPLVGCTKTPPSLLNSSISGGCTQTPPSILPGMLSGMTGSSGDTGWDNEGKDPEKVMLTFMKISGWLALFYKYTEGSFLFL